MKPNNFYSKYFFNIMKNERDIIFGKLCEMISKFSKNYREMFNTRKRCLFVYKVSIQKISIFRIKRIDKKINSYLICILLIKNLNKISASELLKRFCVPFLLNYNLIQNKKMLIAIYINTEISYKIYYYKNIII